MFCTIGQKLWQMVKTDFNALRGSFLRAGVLSEEINLFCSSWSASEKISDTRLETFGRFVKTAFTGPWERSENKKMIL